MNSTVRIAWSFLTALTLSACAATLPSQPVEMKESARLNLKGGKAMTTGDYLRALDLSRAAGARALAIDRVDEAVDELINQGVILRRLDRRKEALEAVETGWRLIADDRAMDYKDSDEMDYDDELVRLAILGADLALDAGDVPGADRWLKGGAMACGGCDSAGAFLNLRARQKWLLDAPAEAVALAREGVAVNRQKGNRLEEGHSLRLLGRWEDDPAKARDHFMTALAIDRSLAVPSLIADDLVGVGESLRRLGKEDEARRYIVRARAIASATGDAKRISICDALLGSDSTPSPKE
ncbi:MAG: hypothetical protein HQK87_04920 [Nitrospinae bacterium]|nr:hypothetical protein [Nitrospinota bacterium]